MVYFMEPPSLDWEIVGSIPNQVKTVKMLLAAILLLVPYQEEELGLLPTLSV